MHALVNNATLDTLHAIEQSGTAAEVKEIFRRTIDRYGFTFFLCAAPPPDLNEIEATGDHVLMDAWPEEWHRRYAEKRYFLNDAMLAESCRTSDPFTWHTAMSRAPLTPAAERIMDEAADFGMCEGFVVPVYGVGGQVHVVTMTGREPRIDARGRFELHMISIYACNRLIKLQPRRFKAMPASPRNGERGATKEKDNGRGAYRVGIKSNGEREAMLDDPDVVEFAAALERIKDPEKRASIEWLVRELSPGKKNGK
jgi:Autoinducer binding domain